MTLGSPRAHRTPLAHSSHRADGFDADTALEQVFLGNDGTRVTLYPELGGKFGELEMVDRSWLWTSDRLPLRRPIPGSSYVSTADSGGWDECFPTLIPCVLPEEAGAFAGEELPDHGELWSEHCRIDVEPAVRDVVRCTWIARRLPALFERTARILDDGTLSLDYVVKSEAHAPLPFLWSSHPLFPLTAGTRLVLPEGAPVRVGIAIGVAVDDRMQQWPRLRLRDGSVLDASNPGARSGSWAIELFVETGDDGHDRHASLIEDDAELRFGWRGTTHFGLWLNHGGWTPLPHAPAYMNLRFGPCIGASDSLAEALAETHGAARSAAWLDVGERRAWSLQVSARRL